MFLWDADNIEHIALHEVAPREAEEVVWNDPIALERQLRGGEVRLPHLGETRAGRILFVVLVERGHDVRVVTAYPADARSRRFYLHQKGHSRA